MQADDFFNAYLVLNQSNEIALEKLQKLAEKSVVNEKAFGAFPTSSPSIVCLAFSIELYIKDIYSALNIKLSRKKLKKYGHNILKLFDKLPEHTKQDIFSHDLISQNPFMIRGDIFSPKRFSSDYSSYDRFRDQIKAISSSFVKWRYSYEYRALNYDLSFALTLIEVLKLVSDNIRTVSKI